MMFCSFNIAVSLYNTIIISDGIVQSPGHLTLVYGCKAPESGGQPLSASWFRYPTSGPRGFA